MATGNIARDLFDLTGRVAFVTGASRGLGWEMAQILTAAGATVVLSSRDRAVLEGRKAEIEAAGGKAAVAPLDVGDSAAIPLVIADVAKRHGRLDILVGNAGMTVRKALVDLTDADWQTVIHHDLSACFALARECAKVMIPAKAGRIIFTSSIMAQLGRPTNTAYVAAKSGLSGFMRGIAAELAPHNITCNAIAPGYFATELTQPLVQNQEFTGYLERRVPMARWGQPREIAGAALYLASDAASYVTGHTLTVDGGLVIGF